MKGGAMERNECGRERKPGWGVLLLRYGQDVTQDAGVSTFCRFPFASVRGRALLPRTP